MMIALIYAKVHKKTQYNNNINNKIIMNMIKTMRYKQNILIKILKNMQIFHYIKKITLIIMILKVTNVCLIIIKKFNKKKRIQINIFSQPVNDYEKIHHYTHIKYL